MRKKAERRWTLMVVPHGSGSSRAVEVSQTFVKALVGIGSVVALTFLVLGVAAISRGVNITHSRALENENRLLADEIQRMRERMTGLRDTLQRFGQREQELRLLAGLTPTDTTVQQAGIGGPAGMWSERDSLKALGPGGQQARAARQHSGAVAERSVRLAVQEPGAPRRDAVDHAYQGLAHERVHAGAHPPDPSLGAPTRGDRRDGDDGGGHRSARGGHRDRGAVGGRLRQHRHDGSRLRAGDALRPLLEDPRRARPAREAWTGDREGRLDRALHGTAPAL